MESERAFKIFLIKVARSLNQNEEKYFKTYVKDFYQIKQLYIPFIYINTIDVLDLLCQLEKNGLISVNNSELLSLFFIEIRRNDLHEELDHITSKSKNAINREIPQYFIKAHNSSQISPGIINHIHHEITSISQATNFIQNIQQRLSREEKDYFKQFLDWYNKFYKVEFHLGYNIAFADFAELIHDLFEKQVLQTNGYHLMYNYFKQINRKDLGNELNQVVASSTQESHSPNSSSSFTNDYARDSRLNSGYNSRNNNKYNNNNNDKYNNNNNSNTPYVGRKSTNPAFISYEGREYNGMVDDFNSIDDKQLVIWSKLIHPGDWKFLAVKGIGLSLNSVERIDHDYNMYMDKVLAVFLEWKHLSFSNPNTPPYTKSGFKEALTKAKMNYVKSQV